jgi:hypothetical protein
MESSPEQNRELEDILIHVRSDDPEIRKGASKALGNLATAGDKHLVGPLIRLLSHPDYLVRFNACEALGKIGDKRALRAIIARLRDEKRWVRESACRSLGVLGDDRAVEPLLERLGDSFDKAREAAFKSLEIMGESLIARAILLNDIPELLKIVRNGDSRPIENLLNCLKNKETDKITQNDIRTELREIFKIQGQISERFMCKEHYSRFAEYQVSDIKQAEKYKIRYYACRKCSRTLFAARGVKDIIAVLDDTLPYDVMVDSDRYYVNIFAYPHLFDFSQVEITRTDDRSIERFCLKVWQDDDPVRKENFKNVKVLIHPDAGINEWSEKILRDVFGKVF